MASAASSESEESDEEEEEDEELDLNFSSGDHGMSWAAGCHGFLVVGCSVHIHAECVTRTPGARFQWFQWQKYRGIVFAWFLRTEDEPKSGYASPKIAF